MPRRIDQQGVIQPLVVRFDKTDGLYEFITGERRWRAAMQAGLYEVPVITRNELSLEQACAASQIENIQREYLTPIEEAQAIRRACSVKTLTERVNDTKAILSGQASRGAQPDRNPNIERLELLIREIYRLPREVTFSDSR